MSAITGFAAAPGIAVQQLYRLLMPGGRICIADLDAEDGRFHGDNTGVYHFGFERDRLHEIFCQTGFINVTIETATHIVKADSQQNESSFSVFLLTAGKPATP